RLDWFPFQPSSSRGGAKSSSPPRLLKPRTPLDCPACCHSSPVSTGAGPSSQPVRPWCEVKSRRGARHSHTHRRVRLSEPAVLVLCAHRRSRTRAGGRWQARPCRADPVGSLPSLPHHVQCSTRHSVVSFENPLLSGRHGAHYTSRRVGSFVCRARLQLSTSH